MDIDTSSVDILEIYQILFRFCTYVYVYVSYVLCLHAYFSFNTYMYGIQ